MRIIPKYQLGAGVNLIQFTPLPSKPLVLDTESTTSSSSLTESKKDEGLLSESIIKELMTTGLPSDFQAFLENSSIFQSSIFDLGLSEADKHAKHERDVRSLLMYATKMRLAKDEYEKARDHVKDIKAESEIAISTNGGVFVERNGELTLTSINEIQEGDIPITNAQLEELRVHSPHLAFNNHIISSLKGATSMTEIRTVINNAVSNMGNNDMEYVAAVGKSELDKDLLNLLASVNISINDLLSMDTEQLLKLKVKDNSNARLLQGAINTVLSSLDRTQITLLQYKAKLLGILDVTALVTEMMSSYAKGSRSVVDISDLDLSSNRSKKDPASENMNITPLMAYATGKGGANNKVRLTPGNTVVLEATGQTWGAPMDNDSNTIGPSSLQYLLNKGFGPLVDSSNGIYIGDQKVFVSNYNNVYFDGLLLSRVYLPYTKDEQGAYKPNLELFARYKDICEKAASDSDKIKLLQNDPILSQYVDSQGNLRQELLKPFFAVSVYADGNSGWFGGQSGVINPDKIGNGFIHKAKDLGENEEAITLNMYRVLGTKESPYNLHGDVYKGVAFIPIRDEAAYGAMWASGVNPTINAKNATNVTQLPMTDMRFINHQNIKSSKLTRKVNASADKL